jgi:hypothetical protein
MDGCLLEPRTATVPNNPRGVGVYVCRDIVNILDSAKGSGK